MSGSEKILSRIRSDCDESIRAIGEKAEKESAAIIAEAKKTAEANAAEMRAKTDKKLLQLDASAKSRSELETRNALLKRRRIEIDKTVEALADYLTGLDDDKYFEAIYRLAEKLSGKSGEVCMNSRDLGRLPADFTQRLSGCGVNASVSQKPAKISGGFILKNGGIEENMSFEALISDRRDSLEDLINSQLFAR